MLLAVVAIGVVPSFIWLWYWLRKDQHPEPKILITKTFLLGIMLSPLAIVAQLLFVQAVARLLNIDANAFNDSPWFYLWAALVEETVKWLVVYFVVMRSPEFDEPVDAMIYMLTAAMGFAAMENILVINRVFAEGALPTLSILALRFAGATLLHALSSALLGYFIALSWFYFSYRKRLFWLGLGLATLFHWSFNLFISQMQETASLVFSTALLIVMAFLISVLFDKIEARDSQIRTNTA